MSSVFYFLIVLQAMFTTFELLSIISAVTAFLLNLSLLPIIAFRSSDRIGSYKYLILINTAVSTCYAVMHAILVPVGSNIDFPVC